MMTVPSENHGDMKVWQEVRPDPAIGETTYVQVWAARAGGSLGYGETPAQAIISALEGVELARQDVGSPSGRVEYNFSLTGQGSHLPAGFWASLSHGMNISAIKILRDETGISHSSAAAVVSKILEPKAPVFPGTVSRNYVAEQAPNGTVIRIKGEIGDGLRAGFVFEKIEGHDLPPWSSTGDETDYADSEVQEEIDKHGYDLLYVPGARA